MNSYIIVEGGISCLINMKPYAVDESHPNYSKIVDALKANDYALVEELVNIAKSLVKFCGEKIAVDVDNGVVSFKGEEIHSTLASRILTMMKEGFDVMPLVNFLENLMQNPSKRSVDELYGFLEFGKMPITPDGHFLAYKRVNNDYTSVHDSKTDNSIGKVVKMERNKVDDNKDSTCSHGLHFCSHGYLNSFSGEKVVVLKVNPRDVVSIPSDYNNTKGRACEYVAVGELSPSEVKKALGGNFLEMSVVDASYEDADRDFEAEEDGELETETSDFIDGYDGGYADGRDKVESIMVLRDVPGSEYEEGYVLGYKDGRGHKSKRHFIAVD